MIGYLQSGNFSRPSCYTCHFKGFPKKADITLADFWGIENFDASMDQDCGTSLVMVNSKKGLAFFEELSSSIISKQFTLEQGTIANQAMYSSLKANSNNRVKFFKDLDKYPFEVVAKSHFPLPNLKYRIMNKLKLLKKAFPKWFLEK